MSGRIYSAVGLVSAALVIVQISVTRLLSYKLFYHFVFLAIALTLLGLGAAGTYVATRRGSLDGAAVDRTLIGSLSLLSVLPPLAFLAIANPSLIETGGELRIKLIGVDAMHYLLWCSLWVVAINFAGGVVLTCVFRSYSQAMGRLYATDLVGAGLGCLACVSIMKLLSPPAAFVAASLLALAALVPFLRRGVASRRLRNTASGAALLAVVGVGMVLLGPESWRDFQGFRRTSGQDPTIFKYEWNHLIRTDHTPGRYVIDGEADSKTVVWDERRRVLPVRDPAYALVRKSPEVAIIGFGGGPQVDEARRAEARRVTAIEINPTIARWVLEEDLAMNNGLFAADNIEVVVGEGRHVIRSSQRTFDLIVMHAIDTYAATATGAYALTENFLYTEEAILDFLDALSDGGFVSIRRWLFNPPRENLRLFITVLEALSRRGVAAPERHLAMVAPIPDYEMLRAGRGRAFGYLLATPDPMSRETVLALRRYVAELDWSVLYAPDGDEINPFADYVRAADRRAFRASYPYYVAPVTDASPYLFQFYNPLHRSSYQDEEDWTLGSLYQSSAILLLVALVCSLVLSFLLILGPLAWSKRSRVGVGSSARRLELRDVTFFACLGVGFMALEVPLTQVLSLFLGHPTYGFSIVLVALLVAAGAGSLLIEARTWRLPAVCGLVALVLAAMAAGLFPLVHGTIHLSFAVRVVAACLLVIVCGLPMGLPFALAVRDLGRRNAGDVPWAWGINAAASVVGSCAVMIVMVYFGTRLAFALASACYLLAALVTNRRAAPTASAA